MIGLFELVGGWLGGVFNYVTPSVSQYTGTINSAITSLPNIKAKIIPVNLPWAIVVSNTPITADVKVP